MVAAPSAEAAVVWAARYRLEREAELRFASLASRLEKTGARPEVVALTRAAAADEARHSLLCAEVVAHLGAAPPTFAPPAALGFAPRGLAERERVLYELVAFCCVAESVSACTLTLLVDGARDERIRDVLRAILRDEVQHARAGWAHLHAEREAGRGAFLADLLPRILDGAIPERAVDDATDDALAELGCLSGKTKARAYAAALRDVIFPGLEHLGVPAASGRAWLEARGG